MELAQAFEVGVVALIAGALGSMMGLGGGLFLVPILTSSFFALDLTIVRPASLIAVCVTSMGGSLVYIKRGLTDLKSASFLQLPTAIGAVCGVIVSDYFDKSYVQAMFAAFLLFVAVQLIRKKTSAEPDDSERTMTWPPAILACLAAGVVSSLLGVGGGIIFVPVLVLLLHKSSQEAAATSTYLIGLTGAASALLYVAQMRTTGMPENFVNLSIACAVGIFIGAQIGARLGKYVVGNVFRYIFVLIIIFNAGLLIEKVWKAWSHG